MYCWEAKNSWLTGTAAWNFHAIAEHILGIKPDYDGLRIEPCIPREWPGYTVTRRFRGATYTIRIDNPAGVGHGVKSMHVDGVPVDGTLVEAMPPGSKCEIVVELGDAAVECSA